MRKLVSLFFAVIGFSLFGAGIYTSFEIYATKKQEKINANLAGFVISVFKGEEVKKLDYPDQSFFVFKSPEGKILISGGALQNPIDVNLYSSYHKKHTSNAEVFIYLRRYNFGEFIEELIRNPASLGISLSGIVFFLIGVLYTIIQKPPYQEEKAKPAEKGVPEDVRKKLKALRLALSVHKIIPEESSQEAKRILDDILKEMEGRK